MKQNKSTRGDAVQPAVQQPAGHPAKGVDWPTADAVEVLNRAIFEEWVKRYGSWDAFLTAARRGEVDEPKDSPTKH